VSGLWVLGVGLDSDRNVSQRRKERKALAGGALLPMFLGFCLTFAGCDEGVRPATPTPSAAQSTQPGASSVADALGKKPSVVPQPTVSLKPAPLVAAPVVDSDLTLDQALEGTQSPVNVKRRQRLVVVSYYSFDKKLHQGQLLVDEDLADEVKEIFREIEKSRFPIAKVVPVCRYGWSDDESMADDNTSAFNYRTKPESSQLSQHAFGRAIDINPVENPYFDPHKSAAPKYDPSVPGTLSASSAPTVAFLKHGWHWGGFWSRGRDYQHFEK